MKLLTAVLFFLLVGVDRLSGCTTFFINKDGRMVFGRNYDWVTDAGFVCKNARGLSKTTFQSPGGKGISWVSRYGSLTFNQYGKEFPTGGMNEKGLVVELMWLDGSEYPKPDDRASISVLQWIQYQLDNCSTIDEVIATDNRIRIGDVGNPPLHYLVADANGKAATIEFLKGEMVVHKGNDLPIPVLTNTDYATSARITKDAGMEAGRDVSEKFNDNSIQRFAKACSMVQQFQLGNSKQSVIDFSFNILKQVAQEGWTRWSIVYDITNKTIYFKTARFTTVKTIAFADFDFSCSASSIALDMNQSLNGKVSQEFKPMTIEVNKNLVERSAKESRTHVYIGELEMKQLVQYAAGVACKQ